MSARRFKILLGKPGLDGHDVGAKVLAHALTAGGFDVVYSGLRKPVEEIIRMAVENEADVIGLSILSGTHLVICEQMKAEMDKRGLSIPWVVGGNIPDDDVDAINALGATAAFATGTRLEDVVDYFSKLSREQKRKV